MAIEVIDTIKPKNGQSFPIAEASDILMSDGSRLSEVGGSYPMAEGVDVIKPDTYYVFGEVNSLSVTLDDPNDGRAHEYSFEFIPTEDFEGLTITPEPRWAGEPQFAAGKTCQVSILRGIGAMISA